MTEKLLVSQEFTMSLSICNLPFCQVCFVFKHWCSLYNEKTTIKYSQNICTYLRCRTFPVIVTVVPTQLVLSVCHCVRSSQSNLESFSNNTWVCILFQVDTAQIKIPVISPWYNNHGTFCQFTNSVFQVPRNFQECCCCCHVASQLLFTGMCHHGIARISLECFPWNVWTFRPVQLLTVWLAEGVDRRVWWSEGTGLSIWLTRDLSHLPVVWNSGDSFTWHSWSFSEDTSKTKGRISLVFAKITKLIKPQEGKCVAK